MPIVASLAGAFTVNKIIEQAMRDVGIIGDGQTPNAAQTELGLDTLNQMMAQWATSDLMVYALDLIVIPATGAVTYEIGAGATVNVTRPDAIQSAVYRDGSSINSLIYTPLTLLPSLSDWEQIALQGISASPPSAAYYNATWPYGTLYVWPQPASGQIELVVKTEFPLYLSPGDDVALPPEYAAAMRFNLAKWLCAANGSPLRPDLAQLAAGTLKVLKRSNSRIRELQMPNRLPEGSANSRFNIYNGAD